LAHKAKVNARDVNGWTALHLAAQHGRYSSTKVLLKHGADPQMCNEHNQRAIDLVETVPHVSGDGKWIIAVLRRDWSKSTVHESESGDESEVSEAPAAEPAPATSGSAAASPAISRSNKKHLPVDRFGFVVSDENEIHFSTSGQEKDAERAKKWARMLREWEMFEKKHRSKIRERCDKGIPNMVRGQVWRKLTNIDGLRAAKQPYKDYLGSKGDDATIEQIAKDLNRTLPTHFLFAEDGGKGQQMLGNVLNAFANYDPSIGYCQGMGFITAMALMYMTEEDSFWFLVRIANDYKLGGLWKPGLPALGQTMFVLENLIGIYFPKLLQHLNKICVPPAMYAPQFFITGYLYNLPFFVVLRIWDSLLVRGFDFLYAVLLSLFRIYEDRLLKMEFEELMTFLRFYNTESKENLMVFDADLVIRTAISFKLTNQVKELEEEFAKSASDSKHQSKLKALTADGDDDSDSDAGSFVTQEEQNDNGKNVKARKSEQKKSESKKKDEKEKKDERKSASKKK